MADFKKISLQHFKGAEKVTIDFSAKHSSPVITLIGLNESGKTTILEGLASFISSDDAVSDIFKSAQIGSIIPMHRKAAFAGNITVSADFTLDDADISVAKAHCVYRKLKLVRNGDEVRSTKPFCQGEPGAMCLSRIPMARNRHVATLP
jgi:predicted ATP-dependent endonuclease of OLD family